MPWIDDEMKAAVAKRLRDVHGMEGVEIHRIHVDLGPKATRENVVEQLADSLAELEKRRRAGALPDQPVRSNQPQIDVRDLVRDL
jgi:hypothetical protein